jgi:hypothetical protein
VAKLNPAGGLAPGGYFFLFGGNYDSSSKGHSIAVDAQGHAYVAGTTLDSDFPTTPNAFRPDPCPGGEAFVPIDGFVAKVNAAGNDLVYSTFLCGSGDDSPNAIGVDPDGHAYVAGYTGSSDFPTQPSQPHPGEMFTYNGLVTKLTADDSALVYSTLGVQLVEQHCLEHLVQVRGHPTIVQAFSCMAKGASGGGAGAVIRFGKCQASQGSFDGVGKVHGESFGRMR